MLISASNRELPAAFHAIKQLAPGAAGLADAMATLTKSMQITGTLHIKEAISPTEVAEVDLTLTP